MRSYGLILLADSGLQIFNFFPPNSDFFPIRNEPITSPHEQQKKRKRKDMAKGLGGSDEGNTLNKHMAGKKAAGTSLPLTEKNSTYPTLVVALPTVNNEEMMVQNQSGSAGINVKKKSAIVKGSSLQSPLRVTNGEAVGEKGGKAKAGVLPAKNHGGKSKDGLFDMSNQMLIGNISSQGKPQYGRSLSSGEDVGQSAQQGEKNRIREHSDSIFSEGRNPMQATVSNSRKNLSPCLKVLIAIVLKISLWCFFSISLSDIICIL